METMETEEGQRFPMAGVLKGESFPAGNRRFGYIELTGGRLFGKPAGTLRAHEFHYYDSTCCGEAFTARKSISGRSWKCMISEETMLAGYPHLHYRGNPQVGEAFLYACRKYQRGRNQ